LPEARVPPYCRFVSIVLTAAAAAAAPAQQPGSAGATRPKLEVLGALPEAQLFPLMNLIGTSLGVRCDYCHVQATPDLSKTPSNAGGWVWDRDDKKSKRTARDMMKMVVGLNTSLFGGEAKVTCFTCHRGSTQPVRLPSLPPVGESAAHTPSPTPLPAADRVLAAYVAAVGRVDAPAGTGTIIRGWDERSEGRYGKFEITVAGSDRYQIELTTSDVTTKQGLIGDVAWVAANDRVQRLTSPADLDDMSLDVRMAFRNIVGRVVVKETAPRAAYNVEVELFSEALTGGFNLDPAKVTSEEMLQEQEYIS